VPRLVIADLGDDELALTAVRGDVAWPPPCVLTSRVVLGSPARAGACPSPSACVSTLWGIFCT